MTKKEIENQVRRINKENQFNLDLCKTMAALNNRLIGFDFTWKDVNNVELGKFIFSDIKSINLVMNTGIGIGISVHDKRLHRNYTLPNKEVNI